jgi:hypothetical protein
MTNPVYACKRWIRVDLCRSGTAPTISHGPIESNSPGVA